MAEIGNTRLTSVRLWTKFTSAVVVHTLLIATLIVLVQQCGVRKTINRETAAQAVSIADTIESTAGYYVIFGLTDDLKSILRDLAKNQTVEYADFLSSDGTVLASTDARKVPQPFTDPQYRTRRVDAEVVDGTRHLHLSVRPFYESRAEKSAPRGFFRLATNDLHSRAAVRGVFTNGVWVILLALAVSVAVAVFGSRLIVRPVLGLVDAATEIAKGNLGKRVSVFSNDELGSLGKTFNSMAQSLEKTISKVQQSQERINSFVDTVESRSKRLIEAADEQRVVIDDAYFAIDTLNGGIRKISENVEALSASSEETSSSILEMVASIEEVGRHTDSLFNSVEETSSSTTEMVSSINEVDRNVEYLQNFVTDTSAAMLEMSASIGEVERNAARSYDLALAVADAAESGMKAVRETMDGMEQIRRAVAESNDVVSRLGHRSEEIGKILNVIDDIAEQTNLLALNAAILAAQAGEQGKGFSVVAAEIRDLSERTATSTKEIGTLIRSVQTEVSDASKTMSQGSRMVEGGVDLAHQAGRELNKILESAVKSSEMGKEIANATREQAKGSETVTHSIDRVREMVTQINAATSQQAAGSTHIMKAVETMRDVTKYVRQASTEQKSGSGMISKAAERMIDMVHEIFEVTATQANESERIVRTMERVREIAEANRASAAEMHESLDLLNDAIRGLEEEVRKFRLRT